MNLVSGGFSHICQVPCPSGSQPFDVIWGGDTIKTSQKTQKVEYIRNRMDKPDWKLADELDETIYYVWLVKEVKRNPKLQRKRGHIKR